MLFDFMKLFKLIQFCNHVILYFSLKLSFFNKNKIITFKNV